VRAAVDEGADLSLAAEVALTQRVSPLLWKALTDAGAVDGRQDETWATNLKKDAARCKAHALLVLPLVAPRALAPLADAGFVPLVFKGATLAARYPGPGMRPMDDVDLLLPPDQLDGGVAALEKAGWKVVPLQGGHHEVILTHEALPGLPLELHRALATWRERSNHLTSLDLWRWRADGRVLGERAFVLPLEEEIVALAAHAAKPFHVFDRLIWAVDVAVAIERAQEDGRPVDWERVAKLTADTRCGTAMAVALTQAARLGASSPDSLRRCPAERTRARALVPVLSTEWPLLVRDGSMRRRLRYALVDDWQQRVTLLVGHVTRWGAASTPRHAVELSARGLRRWWRLRRETVDADGHTTSR
jgi:hypothetical protein